MRTTLLAKILISLAVINFIVILYCTQSWSKPNQSRKITEKMSKHFQQRIIELRNACVRSQLVPAIKYRFAAYIHQVYTIPRYHLATCVVPKSGCSFMKQVIYYLNNPSDLVPKNMNYTTSQIQNVTMLIKYQQNNIFFEERAHVHSLFYMPILMSTEYFRRTTMLKVIFTRNPYSRLFSAYLDKIYVPIFWKVMGKIQTVKQILHKQNNTNKCDMKNLSFKDFLEFIIYASQKGVGDIHWFPVSTLCDPCNVQPDIIIRQETYKTDLIQLLQLIKVNDSEFETINSHLGSKNIHSYTLLHGIIQTMFNRGFQNSQDCFTALEMAHRIWDTLILQGQVYMGLAFPAERLERLGDLTASSMADIFISEIKKMPITANESLTQRQQALARAYRKIRPDIIVQIQALYYHDFINFGYSFELPT